MEITPYYNKNLVCICCKQPFQTGKLRSRFVRVKEHETDFKPIYVDDHANALYYNVAVCPHCGFSFTEDFTSYFAPGTKEVIEQTITAKWNGRSYDGKRTIEAAMETYKLAYLSGQIKKEKPLTLAGITLRLAWLYRDKKDLANEQRFMTFARDLYVDAFSAGDHVGTQMSETRVMFMIAELSWRIGDIDAAIRNFSRVIENQRRSTEPKIIEIAKERWAEIREIRNLPEKQHAQY